MGACTGLYGIMRFSQSQTPIQLIALPLTVEFRDRTALEVHCRAFGNRQRSYLREKTSKACGDGQASQFAVCGFMVHETSPPQGRSQRGAGYPRGHFDARAYSCVCWVNKSLRKAPSGGRGVIEKGGLAGVDRPRANPLGQRPAIFLVHSSKGVLSRDLWGGT